ncbi:MAG: sodium-dependent transporter [Lachnospiraceae bacterium]|nr:sodium-dependent transporter [Lachnospiraceae bacterium]
MIFLCVLDLTLTYEPIVFMIIFLGLAAFIVYKGVDKGIEKYSKILMPILLILIVVIAVIAITTKHTDEDGSVRTGMEGFLIYLIPNFKGLTVKGFFNILLDAMGQLFYSLSVAMGIMVAYGSYVKDDAKLVKSINQIEIFDTVVAFLAGVMIIPTVYTFMGRSGMDSYGPSLMFESLPKIFYSMGVVGTILGCLFFGMVLFAALTSAVSVMEAIVAGIMDKFHISRKKACLIELGIAVIVGIIVCLGYNILFFKLKFPNGSTGQILDVLDYISNNLLMPIVAIGTCILIGWVAGPNIVIDEVEKTGCKFGRKKLYIIMIKFVAPTLLLILLLKSLGIPTIIKFFSLIKELLKSFG